MLEVVGALSRPQQGLLIVLVKIFAPGERPFVRCPPSVESQMITKIWLDQSLYGRSVGVLEVPYY